MARGQGRDLALERLRRGDDGRPKRCVGSREAVRAGVRCLRVTIHTSIALAALAALASCAGERDAPPQPEPTAPVLDSLADVRPTVRVAGTVERAHRAAVGWGGEVTLLRLTGGADAPRVLLVPPPAGVDEGRDVVLRGRLRVLDHTEAPVMPGAHVSPADDRASALPVALALEDAALEDAARVDEADASTVQGMGDLIRVLRDHRLTLRGRLERGPDGGFALRMEHDRCLSVLVVVARGDTFERRVGQTVELVGALRPGEATEVEGCVPVHGVALHNPRLASRETPATCRRARAALSDGRRRRRGRASGRAPRPGAPGRGRARGTPRGARRGSPG